MTTLQLMIDQLESRQSELDKELGIEEDDLRILLEKGRALGASIEAKKEKRNHLAFAVSNLRAFSEIDQEANNVATNVDPWGDAA